MLKKLTYPMLVIFAIAAFLLTIRRSQSAFGPSESMATTGTYTAEVTFDGIMIFQRHRDHYDVGILDKTTAPGHEFKVFVEGKPDSIPIPSDTVWTLNIENRAGQVMSPNIRVLGPPTCDKLSGTKPQEDQRHQWDFCWIMDLETDFHGGGKLEFKSGVHLKPIIHLNNGELYTKYKYPELTKWGPGGEAPYGFVAETIGLTVTLRDEEDLVLRVKGKSGAPGEIFRLTKVSKNAGILNAPPCGEDKRPPTHTHFHFYHELFKNNRQDAYDDVVNVVKGLTPLNPYKPERPCSGISTMDDVRVRTYDHEVCGTAFLGVSSGTLP